MLVGVTNINQLKEYIKWKKDIDSSYIDCQSTMDILDILKPIKNKLWNEKQ